MCSTRQRLAALLREQRSAHGLSLRETADRAGLAPSTLSRWEAGACLPRVPELEALLRSLEVGEREITRILFSLDAPRAARAVRRADTAEIPAPSGGLLLKALRSRARLSVTSLADLLGVNPSTVSRWESCDAHPSQDHVDRLMDVLKAPQDVRNCLAATGVAKLNVERPPYNEANLTEELASLEKLIPEADADLELGLLGLQSRVWWFRDEPGAFPILQWVTVAYAEYLCCRERYREALIQAQSALDSGLEPYGVLGVRAHRCLARADVYRWTNPRPHLGLYTMQRCLATCLLPQAREGVLTDMAEYSWIAGRHQEAIDYAQRAHPIGKVTRRDLEQRWGAPDLSESYAWALLVKAP
ncbi:MAG TPA: helix-turn-helix domain-containing protein [Fimbriimonas sp.]|nr:helix-turn-helix domain-containing protein [Fimbriimonas sp.]